MHLTTAIRRIRGRTRDESGFAMLVALFTLTIATLLVGATYVALTTDTQLTRTNLDQQRAYAAAQAGLAAYTYQLNQNPNYWEQCLASGGGTTPTPVLVPGSTDSGSSEYYDYQPLIATTAPTGTTSCSTSNPTGTMIEGSSSAAAGTFRIESTGWSGPSNITSLANCTPANRCITRTLVAQYRRESFLNFVYYTDYETLDPVVFYPNEPTDCEQHYPNRGSDCGSAISFVPADTINGPLHSEDTLAICGTSTSGPTFGRTSADVIQAAGLSTEGQNGCQDTYNMVGTFSNSALSPLTPPPTDAQLLQVASANGYVYTGKTTIVLNGSTMSVTNSDANNTGPTGASVSMPSNGVIYVQTDPAGCGFVYTPFTSNPYSSDGTCGNVYVSGDYSSSLTIASDNDIVIDGNLYPNTVSLSGNPSTPPTPTGNSLLGLVADNFVRVYHPISGSNPGSSGNCSASNGSGYLSSPYIYAAILAVSHSFIVDNYNCGSTMGTLHVFGTIAQLFRGTVGTQNSGTVVSGYTKDYEYDDRLASLEPPYFLNPESAAWYIQRQTECDNSC